MSLGPSTFRSAALGIAAAASLFGSAARAEGAFTSDQCKLIAATGIEVAKKVGPSKLSPEFKKSFRNFLGAKITCDGPKDILTPRGIDIDAYNTIRDILLSPPAEISLSKAGLRSLDPRDVATRDQKRSELPTPRPGG